MSALIKGIDISVYQPEGKFIWTLIAKEFKFVIVRACFGVSSDKLFEAHVASARKVGLKVGAYIFYRQTQGWEEQFKAFTAELARVNFGAGDIYPVVDLEWPAKADGKTKRSVYNTEAKKLCEALAAKYGKCIIYIAPGFYGTLGGPKWLSDERYIIWLSHYTTKDHPLQPDGLTEWTIWQNRGNTFRNKDGTVKIPGGRAQGFGGGVTDIDTNLAKEIPLIPLPPKPEENEDAMPEDVGDPDHPEGEVEDEPELSEDEPPAEVNPPPADEEEAPKPPESEAVVPVAETTRTKPGLSAILALLAAIVGAIASHWLW